MCRTYAHRVKWLSALVFFPVELHRVRSRFIFSLPMKKHTEAKIQYSHLANVTTDHNSKLPFIDQMKVNQASHKVRAIKCLVLVSNDGRFLRGIKATISSFSSGGKEKGQAAKGGLVGVFGFQSGPKKTRPYTCTEPPLRESFAALHHASNRRLHREGPTTRVYREHTSPANPKRASPESRQPLHKALLLVACF